MGPGNVMIRCLTLPVVMPGVVEEPGKCEICLSLQEVSLQSTHLPSVSLRTSLEPYPAKGNED